MCWLEQDLYGSSRLGMSQPHVTNTASQPLASAQYDGTLDASIDGKGSTIVRAAGALYRYGEDLYHMSVWDALAEDYKSRARFYDATNLVGAYVNAGVFEDKSLTTLSNRVALVNFLTDGTLDISGAENSKNHLEFMKESLDVLQKYKGAGGGNEYDKQFLNKSQ